MQTPVTSVRIPLDIKDEFTTLHQHLGITQSQAIVEALELWVSIRKKTVDNTQYTEQGV